MNTAIQVLSQLTKEQQEARIAMAFERVAATDDGQMVIFTVLENLYYFRPTADAEQQALNNYAKRFLEYFGEDVKYRVLEALVKGKRNGT